MRSILIAIIIAGLWFSPAQATKIIDSTGQLTGATDISVNGLLYNVKFIDGSCITVFDGCDNSRTDFPFQSESSATAASQALLDQVFTDGSTGLFDSDPSLTLGCIFNRCSAHTPIYFSGQFIVSSVAVNYAPPFQNQDSTGISSFTRTQDFSADGSLFPPYSVLAVWTPHIPITPTIALPGTLLLLLSGILGMMMLRRSQPQ